MRIELVTNEAPVAQAPAVRQVAQQPRREQQQAPRAPRAARGAAAPARGGRGAGRGGGRAARAPKTQEQLDAEMDAFLAKGRGEAAPAAVSAAADEE